MQIMSYLFVNCSRLVLGEVEWGDAECEMKRRGPNAELATPHGRRQNVPEIQGPRWEDRCWEACRNQNRGVRLAIHAPMALEVLEGSMSSIGLPCMPTLTPKPPQCKQIWHTWNVWELHASGYRI